MTGKTDLVLQNILLIIKLDSQGLFDRIKTRKNEYLMEFSLKRTREHFKDIFRNRFEEVKVEDLKNFEHDLILLLNQFYRRVEEMKWYLNHTQDMASMMQDKVDWFIRHLKKEYEELLQCIDLTLDNLNRPSHVQLHADNADELGPSLDSIELMDSGSSQSLEPGEFTNDLMPDSGEKERIGHENHGNLEDEEDDENCTPPQFIESVENS